MTCVIASNCEPKGSSDNTSCEGMSRHEWLTSKWCRWSRSCTWLIELTFTFWLLAQTIACKPSNQELSVTELFAIMPATFSGSGFTWSASCDGDKIFHPSFFSCARKCSMRCPNFLTKSWFVVLREASVNHEPFDLDIHVSNLVYRGGDTKTMTVPHAGSFIFIVFVTIFS